MDNKKEMEEYEIKDCAETLMKAEMIKKDPEKMAKVQKYLKEKKKAISSIEDLRAKAQEVGAEEEEA